MPIRVPVRPAGDMRLCFLKVMHLMYPNVEQLLITGMDPDQLRDVVRVFSLGWCEALIISNNGPCIEDWKLRYGCRINSPDWYPGPEWQWWRESAANGSNSILGL